MRCRSVSQRRWIGVRPGRWRRDGGKSWRGASTRRSAPTLTSTPMTWSKSPSLQPVPSPRAPSRNGSSARPVCSAPSNPVRLADGSVRCNARLGPFSSGEAKSNTANPSVTARLAAGIFFPQRPGLRLTPHNYSPSVLGKIARASAREPSFDEAAEALADLAEVTVSGRHATRMAEELGHQLQAVRDHQVHQFRAHQLQPEVDTRPAPAVVGVDGGRMQIREQGDGPGAHNGSWREDKIAVLATAAVTVSDADPEPDLPACFRDRKSVEKLVREIGGPSAGSESDPQAESPVASPPGPQAKGNSRKKPELLVRTYVARTCTSEEFGPMVAAEAQRRNFLTALQGAFLGDGAAWIWKLQQVAFPTFQAILDFLHLLGHLFAAATAAATGVEERCGLFQEWAEAGWRGQVDRVIEQLRVARDRLGPLPAEGADDLAADDPRQILAEEIGYLERNPGRMDDPRYRQQGLPWTSSHVESTVELFNRRVKGSEKFWGGTGAEAMLQLRGAFLSEDARLERHLKTRPCSPFRTYKTRKAG
jgi:hypothetical protein